MRSLRFVAVAVAVSSLSLAQVPARLGYQGRLLRADGTPVSGNTSVGFGVFAASTGGTALWAETQSLGLSDGAYSTFLGDATPAGCSGSSCTGIPPAVFDGTERYLELTINGTVLTPRQRIASVAYALRALNVAGGTVDATSVSINGQTVVNTAGALAGPALTGLVTTTALATPSTINATTNLVEWTQLKNVPPFVLALDGGSGSFTLTVGAGLQGAGTSGSPLAANFAGSGDAGTVARSDHTHAVGAGLQGNGSSGAPLAVAFTGSGSATTAARADHTHGAPSIAAASSGLGVYPAGTPLPREDWVRLSNTADLSGSGTGFDTGGVFHPDVIKVGATYRMYYVGTQSGGGTGTGIGLATSSDGITWVRSPANPVIARGGVGTFDSSDTSGPAIVYDGASYVLFYAAFNGTTWCIARATSTDGTAFTKTGCVLLATQSFEAANYVYTPTVIKDGATWHMWWMGNNGSSYTGVGHATSPDGITWAKFAGNPVIVPRPNSWDEHGAEPEVVKVGDLFVMYYAALQSSSTWAIGRALSTDGNVWTQAAAPSIVAHPGTWVGTGSVKPALMYDGSRVWLWLSGYSGSANYKIGAYVSDF